MKKYLSTIVKKARKERGLSQKALVDRLGANGLSVRTLMRIENDDPNVREESIRELLSFFDIDLRYKLADEYEECLMKEMLDGITEGESINDGINYVNHSIEMYRTFIHGEQNTFADYHITNLPVFLIYYQLMDKDLLNRAVARMGGYFCNRYTYALDQLEALYREIPDSREKRAADNLVKNLRDHGYQIDWEEYKAYESLLRERAGERR